MTRGNWHLLVLEDSETVAQTLLQTLAQRGFALTHRRVTTEAEFTTALQERAWDAVVANYVLVNFSGPAALKCLRATGSDMPFIMVSGIYGEETAVAAMQAGANDYVMKNNLARLAPALEREVAAAESRRRLVSLERNTQHLAAIVQSSEDAIYGKTLDSLIVSWNGAAERIYGYTAAEMIGKSIASLFPHARQDELLDIISAVRRGEKVVLRDTERRRKNGSLVPVSVIISPIKNVKDEVIGASAIARDISEQKKAERERQQLIESLTATAKEVRTLTGMLPICAGCKRIRDDQGYWQQVESYISEHSHATFSHGLCPLCIKEYERESQLEK